MNMAIIVNSIEYNIDENSNLCFFLKENGFSPEKALVSINGKIIKSDEFSTQILNDNDIIDVMSFAGGG
jgi:thiamine biosynthesis protein ThiS